jgi:hypothetical protein
MRLFRREPRALPLPAGPFYHGVAREDQIPHAPMSDSGDGLDEVAPPRTALGPPTLAPGDHVGPLQYLKDAPTGLNGVGYPLRIYELRDVAGLRREGQHDRWQYVVADDAVVERELPAWRYFGPYGEGVPEVLEGIWNLDPDRVTRLVVPPGEHKFEQIPIPLFQVPKDDHGVENAASMVMRWTENTSWAKGSVGGGFYYRGCYFTYIVSDPKWLMAMGLAYNAAVALASGPHIAPAARAVALASWATLAGGPAPAIWPPSITSLGS